MLKFSTLAVVVIWSGFASAQGIICPRVDPNREIYNPPYPWSSVCPATRPKTPITPKSAPEVKFVISPIK